MRSWMSCGDISRNSRQLHCSNPSLREARGGPEFSSLKVRLYNNVFGYYIEISKSNLQHARQRNYERKQTLVNGGAFQLRRN